MTDATKLADESLPCPLCGSDVTKETGFADNFRNGEYQYASCSECSYQADWHDHIAALRERDALAAQLAAYKAIGRHLLRRSEIAQPIWKLNSKPKHL